MNIFTAMCVGFFGIVVAAAVMVVVGAIMAFPVMFFWNMSIASIFSGPRIGYVEAFGLYMLTSFLIGKISGNNASE